MLLANKFEAIVSSWHPPRMTVVRSFINDFIGIRRKLRGVGKTITEGVLRQTFDGKGANQTRAVAQARREVRFPSYVGDDELKDKTLHTHSGLDASLRYPLEEPEFCCLGTHV
jgi:sugar/nucleoside kinase (ribokinase family)